MQGRKDSIRFASTLLNYILLSMDATICISLYCFLLPMSFFLCFQSFLNFLLMCMCLCLKDHRIPLIPWLWRLEGLCSHRTVTIRESILCWLSCSGYCSETETYPESFFGKDLFACPRALT